MKVFAVDPGGTTGVAVASFVRGSLLIPQIRESMRLYQMVVGGTPEDECAGVWRLLEWIGEEEPDVIVMEDFRLFPDQHTRDQSGTAPMRLLAAFDMMWWLARNEDRSLNGRDREQWAGAIEVRDDLPRYVKQMPGMKSVVTDVQLRKWGLWRTPKDKRLVQLPNFPLVDGEVLRQSGGPHAMDALRHLLVFARKETGK